MPSIIINPASDEMAKQPPALINRQDQLAYSGVDSCSPKYHNYDETDIDSNNQHEAGQSCGDSVQMTSHNGTSTGTTLSGTAGNHKIISFRTIFLFSICIFIVFTTAYYPLMVRLARSN